MEAACAETGETMRPWTPHDPDEICYLRADNIYTPLYTPTAEFFADQRSATNRAETRSTGFL